jgi:hypothetical protein
MTQSFVKGDVLICVNCKGTYLAYGNTYTVDYVSNNIVRLTTNGLYGISRFILATELNKALV